MESESAKLTADEMFWRSGTQSSAFTDSAAQDDAIPAMNRRANFFGSASRTTNT
jgi:hypothetical protein